MNEILKTYAPITLEEMSGIRLMNRTDTKYVTTRARLMKVLELAREDYRVQEINGVSNLPYFTRYYDTPRHEMFLEHHNGRKTRQKVRIRAYENTGASFLEIKNKNNHGRTAKKRIPVPTTAAWKEESLQFLNTYSRYEPSLLRGHIENHFNRITLVNRRMTERLTIDTDLCFRNLLTGEEIALPYLAIIELKRDGNTYSPIRETLRKLRVKPSGFSKYCMGMALTDRSLKQNRFKPRLHLLERLRMQNEEEMKHIQITH